MGCAVSRSPILWQIEFVIGVKVGSVDFTAIQSSWKQPRSPADRLRVDNAAFSRACHQDYARRGGRRIPLLKYE